MGWNAAYLLALVGLAPWLLARALRTGRYRQDCSAKLTGRLRLPPHPGPTVWFHGVSVGEIHLLATLIATFRRHYPHWRVVVSSTTDTGLAEARKRAVRQADARQGEVREYGACQGKVCDCEARKCFDAVIPWPCDFTWAVRSALDAVNPSLLVLAESELWPNMLRAAGERGVPVAVVNARLSPRSAKRYARFRSFAQRLFFQRLALIAAQSNGIADRFHSLNVPREKLRVTGSLKYDGAAQPVADSPLHAWLNPGRPAGAILWVAGSTHHPEERIVLEAFARLRQRFPSLHLMLVPRHPDRFNSVAALLESTGLAWQRRSQCRKPLPQWPPVLLLDTIGELFAAWSMADVGFVGGSLDGRRGGQSMIEPAGCGVPTLFGPHVWNFAEPARQLVDAGAAVMVPNGERIYDEMIRLLEDEAGRQRMSRLAREFVAAQQGAAERTVAALAELIPTAAARRAA